MNKHKLPLFLLLSALSVGALAQEEDMTLQQERDRMGADMEENRQQTGRDINRIREPGAPRGDATDINRGGVQSDAINRRPSAPGNANPPAGAPLPDTPEGTRQPTNGPGVSPVPGTTAPAPTVPGGANGNVSPGSGASPGGIGTNNGNGAAASPDGGAATGGPTGGAAGQP
ncbi:hypothetical protein [Pseudomonas lopnurensis]|uniref:hypothetical protein n=1 Tax=Pseudomonas lopnurensis TaxID=1477517 RepID=UPI00187A144E|nr:hypothetical protein [Pseudomonas lopnurensis]MBE7374578.1 hypothetical protein [Pseudomonas lopnurensis]